MKFCEYNCECGANVCGDGDRHVPKCPKCGKVGSWDKVQDIDLVSALEDTDVPDPLEGAIIQPDDPIPQREKEDLGRQFIDALSTMDRYMASKDPHVNSLGMVNDPVSVDMSVHPEWTKRLVSFLESFGQEEEPEAMWLLDNQFTLNTGG